jgi:RNA polymerase sigma factor (sigma-70 family)
MTATEPPSLLPTRRSLLSKLKDSGHHEAWREFFDAYWKLIFHTARRAGLDEQEAQDAVQETMLTVSKEMPGFTYDRSKGRFKNWLLLITRRRVADVLRRRYRAGHANVIDHTAPDVQARLKELEAPSGEDSQWDEDWRQHLLQAAMNRVSRAVKPEHFQAFQLSVVEGHPSADICKALGISSMNLYIIRHRVSGLLKKEVKRLEEQGI